MDLLNNAVESIQVGIEDYEAGTPARLRSCVRSIHAGILLLFKERLRQLSPPGSNELLIKARFKPVRQSDGTVLLTGDGRRTVDAQQIKERFDSLGVGADWSRVEKITRARNDIEHYYTNITQSSLHTLIADAFVVIRDFVRSELGEDPRTLLGDAAWQRMLDVAAVYDQERAECDALLQKVDWGSPTLEKGVRSVSCSACGSGLLRPLDPSADVASLVMECTACGTTIDAEGFVASAVEAELGWEAHVAVKDGAEEPYTTCPECGEDTYILEEQRCALCGESAEHECARCGCTIPASELGGSMCGYCEHMMSKDD
jgi:ribosomal protein L37E